ncbi:hypothetical protein [Frigoriflavimonas asaccharolytica]|uniref:Uncharacterized protein n=1 Tax=Frigoriflavimonas asaccharolytica TaxID=2735899 RepID=A0A8J8GA01_9FLAO|nr:hypothetical protein [Frigoriflavimonas asaccharolytica]NRS92309.1 hypothetical protein [Frigoriflavimonas asaccharolytica]
MSEAIIYLETKSIGVDIGTPKTIVSFIDDKSPKQILFVQTNLENEHEIQWFIYDNTKNKYLDKNDYSGSTKVEMKLYGGNAGSVQEPVVLSIFTKYKGVRQSTVLLNIIAIPEIKNAVWLDFQEKEISESKVSNHIARIDIIQGKGIKGISLIIRIFLDGKLYKESPMGDDHYFDVSLIGFAQEVYAKGEVKLSFQILYMNEVLYNGPSLTLKSILETENSEVDINNISPVVISAESYFTQKYEPCKYTEISYLLENSKEPIVIFDEKTEKKSLDDKPNITVIAGKKGKKLEVLLAKLTTEHCRNLDKYQSKLPDQDATIDNEKVPHGGIVIDVKKIKEELLLDVDPEYNEAKTPQLSFQLKYPYIFLDSENIDYLNFLALYNPLLLHSIYKDTIVNIETCRYRHFIPLVVYPDLAWSFHFQWGNPKTRLSDFAKQSFLQQYGPDILGKLQGNKIFYKDIEVNLQRGLKDEIDAFNQFIERYLKYAVDIFMGIGTKDFGKSLSGSYRRRFCRGLSCLL